MIKNIFLISFISLSSLFLYNYFAQIPEVLSDNQTAEEFTSSSKLNFPKDHGPHDNFTREWWYMNLDLTVREKVGNRTIQKRVGQVFSFSIIKERGIQAESLLSGISDLNTRKFDFDNTQGKIDAKLSNDKLEIKFESNKKILSLTEETNSKNLSSFRIKGFAPKIGEVDLLFEQNSNYKSPTLWGESGNCNGNISIFEKNDTFYYSIPGYVVSGTIISPQGNIQTISGGVAWFDHQWFNSGDISKNWKGHYWTSANISTNRLVNFSRLQNSQLKSSPILGFGAVKNFKPDGKTQSFYFIKRDREGNNSCGTTGDIKATRFLSSGYPGTTLLSIGNETLTHIAQGGREIYSIGFNTKFIEFLSNVNYRDTKTRQTLKGSGYIETSLVR